MTPPSSNTQRAVNKQPLAPSDELQPSADRDVEDFRNLPEIQLLQISHFFEHYKELENSKWVKVERWGDADEARKLIQKAIQRLKQK